MCKNWGYAVLTKVHYEESIDEMKHADKIVERILFLEGVPNLSDYDRIPIGQRVKEQIGHDLALEMAALAVLRPGIRLCLDAGDHATRELLEHILEDEERHVDWPRGPDPQDGGSRLQDLPRPADLRIVAPGSPGALTHVP